MNVDTFKHAGLTVRIEQDSDCESPLMDDDVFITYRKDSRYTLGNTPLDEDEDADIAARIASGELIGLPVYAYVHSGVALSTGSFNDPWDSGRSGWVYVTKATALEWHGGKILTAKRRERSLTSLRSVVEEFGKWCNGECYGYIIEDEAGDERESCWGYIGHEYVEENARSAAEAVAKDLAECKRQAWRKALHEARERKYWAARDVTTEHCQ